VIRQTKFYMALAGFIVATISHFLGKATFAEWAAFMGTLFTLYGVSHITDTHMQQKKLIPPEAQTS
jgi:uncharacterized membrane protein